MIIYDTMMAILSSGLSEGSSHQVIAVSSVYGTVWVVSMGGRGEQNSCGLDRL